MKCSHSFTYIQVPIPSGDRYIRICQRCKVREEVDQYEYKYKTSALVKCIEEVHGKDKGERSTEKVCAKLKEGGYESLGDLLH